MVDLGGALRLPALSFCRPDHSSAQASCGHCARHRASDRGCDRAHDLHPDCGLDCAAPRVARVRRGGSRLPDLQRTTLPDILGEGRHPPRRDGDDRCDLLRGPDRWPDRDPPSGAIARCGQQFGTNGRTPQRQTAALAGRYLVFGLHLSDGSIHAHRQALGDARRAWSRRRLVRGNRRAAGAGRRRAGAPAGRPAGSRRAASPARADGGDRRRAS